MSASKNKWQLIILKNSLSPGEEYIFRAKVNSDKSS